MTEIDESINDRESPEIEKNWLTIKKKLARKVEDSDSVGVTLRVRQLQKQEEQEEVYECKPVIPQSAAEEEDPHDITTPTLAIKSPQRLNASALQTDMLVSKDGPSALQTKVPMSQGEASAFPRPYGGSTSKGVEQWREEADGSDQSGITLLRAIAAGTLNADDLTVEERRLCVSILKNQGKTQDEISAMLAVSRRTIVSDFKTLKGRSLEVVRALDTWDVAAEVWDKAQACVFGALTDGKYKTVTNIMRDTVEMLQSLGVIYKAPTRSNVASLVGRIQGHQGFTNYLTTIGDEKDQVINVLNQMMEAVKKRDFE